MELRSSFASCVILDTTLNGWCLSPPENGDTGIYLEERWRFKCVDALRAITTGTCELSLLFF